MVSDLSRLNPVPILAVYTPVIQQYAVTFNREIKAQALDHTNWSARRNNTRWNITAAQVLTGKVILQQGGGLPEPGPDAIDFSPPPFDVTDLHDIPALAFSDFPIT